MYGLLPDLTKDYILKRVTQEEIFEKFTGIPVQTTDNFSSPFRLDKNPSCEYRYNHNGRLRMIDYSGFFNGDCFDAVAFDKRLNTRNKKEFMTVLHLIAKAFKIHKYRDSYEDTYSVNIIAQTMSLETKSSSCIEVEKRSWSKVDKEIWSDRYFFSSKELEANHVVACKYVWLNDYLYYSFDPKDPAYAYYKGKDPITGDIKWKIYFPYRERIRFISNSSKPEGWQFLIPSKFLVITKAYKDTMCLKRFSIDGELIQAINPHSESILLSQKQMDYLKTRFPFIFTLFDYDPTGLHASWMYRKKYGTIPLYFKQPTWNSKIKYNSKDFSDYLEINRTVKTNELIESVYSNYRDDFNEYFQQEIDLLSFI